MAEINGWVADGFEGDTGQEERQGQRPQMVRDPTGPPEIRSGVHGADYTIQEIADKESAAPRGVSADWGSQGASLHPEALRGPVPQR